VKIGASIERSENKNFMSEANPFLLLLLTLLFRVFNSNSAFAKKLPLRIERKRDSIEFERSENIGQFFLFWVFNNLLSF